jgi:hypothetical protein
MEFTVDHAVQRLNAALKECFDKEITNEEFVARINVLLEMNKYFASEIILINSNISSTELVLSNIIFMRKDLAFHTFYRNYRPAYFIDNNELTKVLNKFDCFIKYPRQKRIIYKPSKKIQRRGVCTRYDLNKHTHYMNHNMPDYDDNLHRHNYEDKQDIHTL